MSSVVIGEFEVVTEPPQSSASAQDTQSAAPPPAPTPQEIAHALRRQAERLARVRAT